MLLTSAVILWMVTAAIEASVTPDAVVKIVPGNTDQGVVSGTLEITRHYSGILITGYLTGLTPGLHGFHIHEKGQLTNNCKDAAGHFNPFMKFHGSPSDALRHVGDLGNILADDTGVARVDILDSHASLDPSSQAYIGGRGIVIHAGEDDLGRGNDEGSLKTGNAGGRVGCGTIVIQQNQLLTTSRISGAVVKIVPGNTDQGVVSGSLEIAKHYTGVLITGYVTGLTPGLHGFHIHMKGQLTNNCKDAAGHFNPFMKSHGSPKDAVRHVGDLGNIFADEKGVARIHILDSHASLDPSSQAYVGGRGIVIHAGEDDLGRGNDEGSLSTGNAGGRVGCGMIVVKQNQPILFPDYRYFSPQPSYPYSLPYGYSYSPPYGNWW